MSRHLIKDWRKLSKFIFSISLCLYLSYLVVFIDWCACFFVFVLQLVTKALNKEKWRFENYTQTVCKLPFLEVFLHFQRRVGWNAETFRFLSWPVHGKLKCRNSLPLTSAALKKTLKRASDLLMRGLKGRSSWIKPSDQGEVNENQQHIEFV